MDLTAWLASHPDVVLASKRSCEVTEVFDGPKETREYDIAECLEQIRSGSGLMTVGLPPIKDAQQELDLTLKALFCRPTPGDNAGITKDGAHQDTPQSKAPAKTDNSKSSPLTYTISGTTLKATAPAALLEKLRRTLEAWSKSGLAQIAVETRFLSADRDLVSDLGVSWQFLEAFSQERESAFPTAGHDGALVVHAESRVDEYLPLVVSTLDKVQTAKLIEIAQSNRRANVLNAPKVTIFNGQEAMIADVVQRPFVVGVFQQTSGANAPKTVVLDEGTKIKVRAVQSRDRKRVHLETSVDMRVLGDVTTASTSYRGQPVSIQVPSVNHKSIDVAADIEDGQTVLVGSIPTGKQKQYLYYLVSASRISEIK
jgi:type II secretory pathway component GspD/PulD (secretin)